jgi:hypothetical protein
LSQNAFTPSGLNQTLLNWSRNRAILHDIAQANAGALSASESVQVFLYFLAAWFSFGVLGCRSTLDMNDSNPNLVVGVAWYRPDQYALLRALATDAACMAATYDKWLAGVTKTMADLKKQGVAARRVDVDVKELVAWCQEEGRELDGAARATFATEKLDA